MDFSLNVTKLKFSRSGPFVMRKGFTAKMEDFKNYEKIKFRFTDVKDD